MAKEQASPETTKEQAYPLLEMQQNSKHLFGVQPEVIAGALYGVEQQEFTVAEMQALIKAFLERKVK